MEPTNTVTYFVRSYFCYVCVGRSKKLKVKSLSHVRLCDSMDCSLPGSSVHGIFLARLLEWIAISFSRGSFQPRDWTWVSHIVDRLFTVWTTREVLKKKKVEKVESEVSQSCPTLCDPMDNSYQAPLSLNSPGKNTVVCCHFLLQFPFYFYEKYVFYNNFSPNKNFSLGK